MTDNSYNGWTNWETWNVVLWIDNEYAIYQDKMATIIRRERIITPQMVESFVREWFPTGTPDMDETDGGLNAVDWMEIASHWQDEADEEREDA